MIQISDDNLAQAPTGIPVEDGTNTNTSAKTAKDRVTRYILYWGINPPVQTYLHLRFHLVMRMV